MSNRTAGKHKAKAVDWGLRRSKNGAVYTSIAFELTDNSGEIYYYNGMMSDEIKPGNKKSPFDITADVLTLLKFNGDFEDFALGAFGNAIDTEQEVSISLEVEPDQNGKPQLRCKWVNAVAGIKDKLDKAALSAGEWSNLKALGSRIKQKTPIQAPTAPVPNLDDIPF